MGLAKVVIGQTYTTCGTPDYFAPEVGMLCGGAVGFFSQVLGGIVHRCKAETPLVRQDSLTYFYQQLFVRSFVLNFTLHMFPPPGDPADRHV